MPIFTLWSLIKDCLGPTPSHKTSSVFELGCGTHSLQSARQYPLKEKQLYCILPTSAAESVPIKHAILLGITILAPFCSLGLCQTQTCSLFNTPVSSSQVLCADTGHMSIPEREAECVEGQRLQDGL
jgi:hypothetical protein